MARKLSMTPNAIAKREARAKYKAESRQSRAVLATSQPAAVLQESAIEPEVEIEAPAAEMKQSLSLKERFLGIFTPGSDSEKKAEKKPAARRKKENLISTVLPTVAAAFVATFSRDLLPQEYKPCAPSPEEAAGMLAPLFNMLSRRVEVAGKASPDVMDLIAALTAGLLYGTRAYVAARQIKGGTYGTNVNRYEQYTDDEYGISRDSESSGTGTDRRDFDWHDSKENGSAAKNVAEFDASDTNGGPEAAASREAAVMAGMLRRDFDGRVGLGLLPRGLHSANGAAAAAL